MAAGFDTAAFERGTDPIARFFTVEQAREIVEFQGDQALQARIQELARKCNEGELTAEEQTEYEGYVRANKFVAIFQGIARKFLASQTS